MFIETLEFTIPVDLCDLFSTLKRGPKSNMEFPASVNSYGTTQDANIQVVLRSNKLTFKVDGVSSDASMISKSECKNLKLSIFDVDRSLMPQEEVYDELPAMVETPIPSKRAREYSAPVRSPPVKSSRTSYSDSPRNTTSNRQQNLNNSHQSSQSQSRPSNDNSLNVKQEPEDPDCIEIEPDPEPDIVPKKESNYYSSCSGDITSRKHSESEKRYVCQHCHKMFASYGARWHHISAVHKKVTFTCVCGRTYKYRHNLTFHQKSCDQCGTK